MQSGCFGTRFNSNKKRVRTNILKCGCEFLIVLAYCIPTFSNPNNEFVKPRRNEKDRHSAKQKKCYVTNASLYKHTNGCKPNYQQGTMQGRASGTLFEIESQMMDHLLSVVEISTKNLKNEHLRAELKLINPSQSFVTSDNCIILDSRH